MEKLNKVRELGMTESEKVLQPTSREESRKSRTPLVFISHDTRDAQIAEAFSRLLGSVSAGVLKSFRSSDRKGNQGIEYGIEWYPEIMKKLGAASDLVCLLTPNSVNRPWVLYEAGVAKGKLEVPVHGVALGISLSKASVGPFAQFQNCDDAVDSLTGLIVQLVSRIPNAEPDSDVIKMQVESFKTRVHSLLTDSSTSEPLEANGDTAIAKMFEEIKVMYQDLPARIARRTDSGHSETKFRNRFRQAYPMLTREIVEICAIDSQDPLSLLVMLSPFKEEFPWLYEIGTEVYRKIKAKDAEPHNDLKSLMRMIDFTLHHPVSRELRIPKERFFELEESFLFIKQYISKWIEDHPLL